MSTVTTVNQTPNQAHFDYDISKIFVFDNRYTQGTLLNASGASKTFYPGTVLGRIAANGKLIPCDSTATDGSQIPMGILKTEITLGIAGEDEVNVCIKGDVVSSKLIFVGAETLATVVTINDSVPAATTYTRTMKDLIQSTGVILVDGDELTGFDNQ